MSEERLVEIETRLTYQEDLVDELNRIVISQRSQIDELTEVCKALIKRFNELPDGDYSEGGEADELPPHY